MKTVIVILLLIAIAVPVAAGEKITVVGPSGVTGTGQYNPDTGRYSITDTQTGQMQQGEIRHNQFGGTTIIDKTPSLPSLNPPSNPFDVPITHNYSDDD
jgi:hypothetical protein